MNRNQNLKRKLLFFIYIFVAVTTIKSYYIAICHNIAKNKIKYNRNYFIYKWFVSMDTTPVFETKCIDFLFKILRSFIYVELQKL